VRRKRKSILDIKLPTYVRCESVSPVSSSRKAASNLSTVGFELTPEQAVDLARSLLVAAEGWDQIQVTAYRLRHMITVTANR
jgi:hypothetical protein